MTSPYINTKLYTIVSLAANQMDNNLYSHLKNNLIRKFEGKCFKHYGCITKIYEILDKRGGIIDPENPMASAIFEIKFACRLSFPLKNRFIICKVEQTTQTLTSVSNGPIRVLLTNDRINPEHFTAGRIGIFVRTKNGMVPLAQGDHVKVKIDSRKFNDKDTIIMCMGVLNSMAKEDEIKKFTEDEYNYSNKFVDYDKFIKLEELHNDVNDIGELVEEKIDDNNDENEEKEF